MLRQNVGSSLKQNKQTSSVLSINILSFADYQNTFSITVDITNNKFTNNEYFIHPVYVDQQLTKNTKFKSYIQSYQEINLISLIKFYYNFDLQGNGPNSKDVQQQVSSDLTVKITANLFSHNKHLNGQCTNTLCLSCPHTIQLGMIHLINGQNIEFSGNQYFNNDNNYGVNKLNNKRGLWG